MAEIKKAKMAPFYRSVCKELKWKEDSKLWTEMTAENEVEIKALDEKIADAEANLGESEHRSVENFSIWLLFTFRSRECLQIFQRIVVYEKLRQGRIFM